jgi:antitoxin CptB
MPPDSAARAADAAALGRLKWRCRRGMRELDAMLQQFLVAEGARLDAADIERFAAVLELPDPTLHAYILGLSEPIDLPTANLLARIRASHRPDA